MATMVVVSRPYYSVFAFLWSATIISQHMVANSLTFELPDRERMCFFETFDVSSLCRVEFQASSVVRYCM